MSRDLTQSGHEGDDMDGVDSMLPDLSHFGAEVDVLRPSWNADGHVDEGTVHAWLDGAFSADDAATIDAHVATCEVCAAQVAEARGLLAASARILGALDGVPAGVVPAEDAARTAARIAAEVPDVAPMPVTLDVPPAARVVARKPRAWHAQPWLRAAAVLVVAIGAGVVWQRGGDGTRTERVATTDSTASEGIATVAAAPSAAAPAAPPSVAVAQNQTPARDSTVSINAFEARRAFAASTARAMQATQVAPTKASEAADANRSIGRSYVVRGQLYTSDPAHPLGVATVRVGRRIRGADVWSASAAGGDDGQFRTTLPTVLESDTIVVQARRIGYEVARVTSPVNGDSLVLSIPMRVSTMQLSAVSVQAAPAPVVERATVSATASIAPAPGNAQTFAGRGVAGGIARGVAAVASRRVEQPPARRLGDYAAADSSRSIDPRIRPLDREQYDRILDNPFLAAHDNPLSTFSIDVDRAAFGNVRRFLTQGQRPPKDAVRIEEMINWFPYDLPEPRGNDPVAITSEVIAAPWQPKHRLVRIALQSQRIATENLPPSNLVFLIDVSGSMQDPNKLPLVKQSLRLLVDALRPQDRVAIVVYAGAAGVVLPSTSGDEKAQILSAIDRLEAGGSTAGGAGIELAYRTAREHFLDRGNNRVVLATDGDFNVGVSSDAELERLIERKRSEGTYLTVLGFGMGNYQDAKMQKLAKAGNGNYAYIDELREAQKVLVHELGATLVTVANDVKLQVEFNPALVQAYRLIGYEDRLLRTEDFNDDKKDAGDMGAGHQVTALYEVVPVGVEGTVTLRGVDSLRYATPAVTPRSTARNGELMFVKLRYKRPGESSSRLMTHAISSRGVGRGSDDTRFAAAVAGFGMLMRDSEYKGTTSAAQLLSQARAALGDDEGGYRQVLIELIERWRAVTAGERR